MKDKNCNMLICIDGICKQMVSFYEGQVKNIYSLLIQPPLPPPILIHWNLFPVIVFNIWQTQKDNNRNDIFKKNSEVIHFQLSRSSALKFLMARKFNVDRALVLYQQHEIMRFTIRLTRRGSSSTLKHHNQHHNQQGDLDECHLIRQ